MSGVVALARGAWKPTERSVPVARSDDRSAAALSTRRLLTAAGTVGLVVALAASFLGIPGRTAGGGPGAAALGGVPAPIAQATGADPMPGTGAAPGG
ncbi:MAG: hypothetical protein WCH74_03275, partial [Chloroflexota bacterium]